ncbi:MAG: alanine racemase [Eubacteriales bacterium]
MDTRVTGRPVWAEVDLSAIAHNMKELRRVTKPGAKVMAVVKANAYGHGAVSVSNTVLANGADYLGVAILGEGRQLREAGIMAPILILGFTPAEQAVDVVDLDLTQTVYDFAGAEALSRSAVKAQKRVRIHIKVDTGLGRLGFLTDISTSQEILRMAGLPNLEIEGIFTHFSVAGSRDKEYTYGQYTKFREILSQLKGLGLDIPIKHAANSAAAIDLPDVHLDMVRVGITIYGLYPSDEVFKEKVDLKPALSLKALAAQVKTVQTDTSISYGRTYITNRETRVATIPIGYADGYTRLLSNKAAAVIRGQRVPQIGTVCMDQIMLDVSSVPDVKVGDEVVLIGEQGGQKVTADELAGLIGTINYEIVCMLGDRIPRVYV